MYSTRRSHQNQDPISAATHCSWHALGIAIPHGIKGQIRTSCPRCSLQRRKHTDPCLAVNIDAGAWYCHHCGWKGRLRARQNAPSTALPGPQPRSSPEEIQRRQAALEKVWKHSRPVTWSDAAGRYLIRRGLWQEPVPSVLRYHPCLPYRHDDSHFSHYPAMVALVQGPQGQAVSIHRTHLDSNGRKANVPTVKKLMPTLTTARGAAVRLDPPGDTLALAEGIETALAVRRSAGVPTWAALSATGLKSLVVPDMVRLAVICADHDANGTGEQAARVLAQRLLAEGRHAKILMPSTPGTDWADALEGGHHG
jgi:putative DNA primase/helicase